MGPRPNGFRWMFSAKCAFLTDMLIGGFQADYKAMLSFLPDVHPKFAQRICFQSPIMGSVRTLTGLQLYI